MEIVTAMFPVQKIYRKDGKSVYSNFAESIIRNLQNEYVKRSNLTKDRTEKPHSEMNKNQQVWHLKVS